MIILIYLDLDIEMRRLAAAALALMTPLNPKYMAE